MYTQQKTGGTFTTEKLQSTLLVLQKAHKNTHYKECFQQFCHQLTILKSCRWKMVQKLPKLCSVDLRIQSDSGTSIGYVTVEETVEVAVPEICGMQ